MNWEKLRRLPIDNTFTVNNVQYGEGWMTDRSLVCCANGDCITGARADLSGIGMWVWWVSVVKQAGGVTVVE